MEANTHAIEPLLEKAEAYGKTSFEILRLKALSKGADVGSTLLSRLLFILVICFFMLAVNAAIALWLGDMLGKLYYGFFLVAGFYAIIGVILFIIHPSVKNGLMNTIIKQLFN